jgi:hypothetical protein
MLSRLLIRVVAVSALLAISLFFSLPNAIAATKGAFPFQPGEKMSFSFGWNLIPGGTGTMEVLPFTKVDGVEVYHFAMTAKSNSFIDLFYKVRDRYESYADIGMTHSLLYTEQKKGCDKRDITVTFDWEREQVQYTNFDKSRKPISVLPGSFDPLSVYYAFRLIDLEVGKIIEIPVTDGKKSVMGRARVTERETILVGGREFDTYRIQPYLEHFGGVFKKSKKAQLDIWLTADEKKIPVRMRVSVIIGSVTFEYIIPEDAEKGSPAS